MIRVVSHFDGFKLKRLRHTINATDAPASTGKVCNVTVDLDQGDVLQFEVDQALRSRL
ncbi:MAG: hypothetical protein ACK55I_11335 [bacterium]